MSAKIDCYIDCVSPFAYFAFLWLTRNRQLLKEHGVEVEFFPMFLGGVNVGSGNKPPWTLPAKAKYGPYDMKRAKKYFNAPNVKSPEWFPMLSLLPQRCLVYIKEKYSDEKFVQAFMTNFQDTWESSIDISKPENMIQTLSKNFTPSEVKEIMQGANDKVYKDGLLDLTKKVVDMGGYGAPWMWVRNKEGVEEPFFGSDRFHFMMEFLGVPWEDMKIKERASL